MFPPFLFLFSLFIEFLCVEYTALSLRCIETDAAFRDRKKKVSSSAAAVEECHLCFTTNYCAVHRAAFDLFYCNPD